MAMIEHGTIYQGGIIFDHGLTLPEGTPVVVHIEAQGASAAAAMRDEEFLKLPFFGMWSNREDMQDSVDWVQKEREAWSTRVYRAD